LGSRPWPVFYFTNQRGVIRESDIDNGKPVERQGRKAMGLNPSPDMTAKPPKVYQSNIAKVFFTIGLRHSFAKAWFIAWIHARFL